MPDITPAYEQSLALLHASSTKLPQPTILPYLNSALRHFLAFAPDIAAAYSSDQMSDADLALLNEAIGYRAVGLWLSTPPAPGFETLLRQELSPGLVEQYQGWDAARIAQSMIDHAEDIYAQIDLIASAATGFRERRSWITRATPTRSNNKTKKTLLGRIFAPAGDGEF